jgi:hypothetical protein
MVLAMISNAHADDDIFRPLTNEQTQSKYASDCGGFSQDIDKDMPPNDVDQKQSGWCREFSTKAILEYYFHMTHPHDHYQNRLSATDLASLDTSQPQDDWGHVAKWGEGVFPSSILEGVQTFNGVYLDRDLPFDQIFDPRELLAKLSNYYEAHHTNQCDTNAQLQSLEKQLPNLNQVLTAAKSKDDFIASAGQLYQLSPQPKSGSHRLQIVPPFNINMITTKTADQYIEEVQKNLHAKRPMIATICGYQLLQTPGLEAETPVPENLRNQCGGHSIVVIGMQPINGTCKIHIRNSWGQGWPASSHGGNAWISIQDFLKMQTQDGPSLVTISSRLPGEPIKNSFDRPNWSYVGPTVASQPNGRGRLTSNHTIFEGQFREGHLIQGLSKTATGDSYNGQWKNDKPDGEGKLTFKNGTVFEGQFKMGHFEKGLFKGKVQGGAYYEGGFVGTHPEGQGRLTTPDGKIYEGLFVDGQFQNAPNSTEGHEGPIK